MNSLDYLIVGFYAVALIAIATYVSRSKKGQEKTPEDYFLAGRSLPWWAIGTSLIAANIAADQIIGMNGRCLCIWNGNCCLRMDRSSSINRSGKIPPTCLFKTTSFHYAATVITEIRYSCQ